MPAHPPTKKLIVGIMDNHIAGFCSLMIKNNLKEAGNLGNVDERVVDENYLQRGIEKILMDAIAQIAMENNCNRIELDSSFNGMRHANFMDALDLKVGRICLQRNFENITGKICR